MYILGPGSLSFHGRFYHTDLKYVSIAYFLEWTELISLQSDCVHTLKVPTDPLQVITHSKSPENVLYTIWAF